MSHMTERVFVIGLDGAPPDHLRRWAAAGELPVLEQIFNSGCVGNLQSSVPWETPSAWASFMTGMNPGKHGVYDFWSVKPDNTVTISSRPSVRAKPFWTYLSERGRKVGVFSVPLTYPAEPVNGFLIAGTPCVPDDKRFTFPSSLYRFLRTKGWDLGLTVFSGTPSSPEDMFELLVNLVRMRVQVGLFLMKEFAWDFFIIHFLETDVAGHRFLPYMSADEPTSGTHRNLLLNFYKRVDAELGSLLSAIDDRTTLIVMSDHGMGPRSKVVSMNSWLVQRGYMQLNSSLGARLKARLNNLEPLTAMHNRPVIPLLKIMQKRPIKSLIYRTMKLGTRGLHSNMGWTIPRWLMNPPISLSVSLRDVAWSKTRAFSLSGGPVCTLYLNVRGRRIQGIIDPGEEFDMQCERIMLRAEIFDSDQASCV